MKYLLLLSTLTLSLTFSSVSSAEWTLVGDTKDGDTKDGDTYYIDADRIRKHGGYVYVWYARDGLRPTSTGNMSAKTYVQVDCGAFRSKVLSVIGYKESMFEGESESYSYDDSEWDYAPPNSFIEYIMNIVCPQ